MAALSVLLVEDEPMIAWMVADIIEAQGLGVAGVFRANAEALCFLLHCRPDAAIVDYSLADGRAGPLARKLKEQGTPFCVISGYQRSVAGPLFDGVVWIDKPFSEGELCCALRACLQKSADLPSYV